LISARYHLQPQDAQSWFASTRWATGGQVSRAMIGEVIETLYDLKIIEDKPAPPDLIVDFF
jgi:hypothetical protein